MRKLVFISILLLYTPLFGQETNAVFGSQDIKLYMLKGDVYTFPRNHLYLPNDLSQYEKLTTIYTDSLNVPLQKFTNGFPGIEERNEWFAIEFTGNIFIDKPGKYFFKMGSDDGSRLIIDDDLVLEMPKAQDMTFMVGTHTFKKTGRYNIKVQYFQAGRPWLGLVLEMSKNGKDFKILSLSELYPVKVKETEEGVFLSFDASLAFDFNSFELSLQALAVLDELVRFINLDEQYSKLIIEGHTDDIGEEDYNFLLGNKRALAVKSYIQKKNCNIEVSHISFGESRPILPNNSEENRAKNRRIEIKLIK